jgi:hypothetical protein
MTEQELRKQVVAQAEYWLGRKEFDMSHRVIIDVYNSIVPLPRGYRMSYYDPWCAAFVSAVGQACGLTDILFPECACDPMIALYKQAGRWMERDDYRPAPGDLIMYDWQDTGYGDNAGSADHVGMVEKVEGNTIWIIEGNCADAVLRQKRSINSMNIRGFCLPDYASAADGIAKSVIIEEDDPNPEQESPSTPKPEQPAVDTGLCNPELPVLRPGDENGYVKAAQRQLISRGYYWGGRRNLFGRETPDGEFGGKAEDAVKDVQREAGLNPDGVVGTLTWPVLLDY